nr:MAG TPA: hypothetical protein [Caudoviricetes sp.]
MTSYWARQQTAAPGRALDGNLKAPGKSNCPTLGNLSEVVSWQERM